MSTIPSISQLATQRISNENTSLVSSPKPNQSPPATMAGCFSVAALVIKRFRRSLTAAGLSPKTIQIDDQTTFHYWGPNPKPGSDPNKKPALVLIQGFGPDAIWQWQQQAVFLAPKFDVYMPDLLFFGGSTTESADRSVKFQAVSVGKLMEKIGVERYSVMGTSYGGFVAYYLAEMWPERVEKVVIASSDVNKTKVDDDELLKKGKVERIEDLMMPTTAKGFRAIGELAAFRTVPRFVPDFLLMDFLAAQNYKSNRTEKIELLRELNFGQNSPINPLQQEVLIIWGDHDQIFPLKKATELKEVLGAKAKLEVLKKTAHVPQIENPRLFNTIVDKFLSESP